MPIQLRIILATSDMQTEKRKVKMAWRTVTLLLPGVELRQRARLVDLLFLEFLFRIFDPLFEVFVAPLVSELLRTHEHEVPKREDDDRQDREGYDQTEQEALVNAKEIHRRGGHQCSQHLKHQKEVRLDKVLYALPVRIEENVRNEAGGDDEEHRERSPVGRVEQTWSTSLAMR